MPWGVQYYEQESWHPVIVFTMSSTMPVCNWFHKDTASNPAANAALTCNKGSALGVICNKLTPDSVQEGPCQPFQCILYVQPSITSPVPKAGAQTSSNSIHPYDFGETHKLVLWWHGIGHQMILDGIKPSLRNAGNGRHHILSSHQSSHHHKLESSDHRVIVI